MLRSLKLYSYYFLKSSFSPGRKFVLHDLNRFLLKADVFRKVKTYSSQEKKQALDKAAGWLIYAQKANSDGGMGSYHLTNKWSSSYPETTGYIIPTQLDYGTKYNKPDAIDSAIRAADFLVRIQKQSGGWQGGRMQENKPEIVFNTGQVIRGMIASYQHTGDKKYLSAGVRAGHWLVEIQHPEGFWKTHALMDRERVYDTFVDVPLLQLYGITGIEVFKTAAVRNLDWIINGKMLENGWFEDCDNTVKKNDRPILHTIAYTIDGLLDSGLLVNDEKYIDAATKAASKLRDLFLKQGFLHGRYDRNWQGSEHMICTGCAQMAIAWLKLYTINKDEDFLTAARKMLNLLISIQERKFTENADTSGAIPGSFPLWGRYEPFAFPNWATKFFCDALLLDEPHPLAPSPFGEGEQGAGGKGGEAHLEREPGGEVCERVMQSASKYPERPALELHNATYTYSELVGAATEIAASISEINDPNPFVAIMADKSFHCYAGILGILMAGKAYLPLNPRFPESRNRYMMEKAGVRTAINDIPPFPPLLLERGPGGEAEMERGNRGQGVKGVREAYLLFTSGTTGQPKGVPVSHSNLSAYLDFMLKSYNFSPEDRFTQIFDLTFDLSVHDIFLAWSSGACLCVPEDNSSFAMSRFIKEKRPTVWFSVPSVVNLMDRMRLLKPGAFPSLRLSFFCGEALPLSTAMAWKKAVPQSRLVNLYGPTEATIAISGYELPEDTGKWKMEIGIVSIGKIFNGNSFRIFADNASEDTGELYLSGTQVVDGYFENPEADKESFFTDTTLNQKFYRTGDMVKLDDEGDLFFLGRKDAEVKISGYRVNLKEIENLLEGYDSVDQAVVIYEQDEKTTGILLAFILVNSKKKASEEQDIGVYCRENLPWYMVPGKFIFVKEIPLNVNGKVDKTALLKSYLDGN
jgi:amino acid adenylation domain-containing protein